MTQRLPMIGLAFFALSGLCASAAAQCADDWLPGMPRPSVNGIVYAMIAIPTDAGVDVVVGGEFELAGDRAVRNLARWDGESWQSVGGGVNGPVRALAYDNGVLWVGGSFGEAGGLSATRLATWDGANWSAFGTGLDGDVYAIVPVGSGVLVGGSFSQIDGQPMRAIARYDGSTWHTVGSPLQGAVAVKAILPVGDSELYIGGTFLRSVATDLNRVARLVSGAWQPMGAGFNQGEVRHLVRWNDQIIASGSINTTGSPAVFVEGVAAWDGSAWQAMNSPFNPNLRYLGVFENRLFASAGGDTFMEYANGSWQIATPLTIPSAPIYCAATVNNQLWVGGQFDRTTRTDSRYVARLEESDWKSVPMGTDGAVWSFCVFEDALYAGGNFTVLEGTPANRIARWTGSAWEPLGVGLNGSVNALAVYDGHLYAGGGFETAGGLAANRVARWDGQNWLSAGDGVSGTNPPYTVSALVEHNGLLYAGGNFERAGSVAASKLASWDGQTWANLSDYQINGTVSTLAVWNGALYLGGHGSISQGDYYNGVARYRPETRNFERTGFGIGGNVATLLATPDALLAGGSWSSVNGSLNSNGVVKWDGATWSDVGDVNAVRRLIELRGSLHAIPMSGTGPGLLRYSESSTWAPIVLADPAWRCTLWECIEFGDEIWAGGVIARSGSPLIAGVARLAPGAGPADVNHDRRVDLADLAVLLSGFGGSDIPAWTPGDLDSDGDIDLQDLALMLAAFGTDCH